MPNSVTSNLSHDLAPKHAYAPASERSSAPRQPANPQLRPKPERREAVPSVVTTDTWEAGSAASGGPYVPPQATRLTHAALASVVPDKRPLDAKVGIWLATTPQVLARSPAQTRAILAATDGLPLTEVHLVAIAGALGITLHVHEAASEVGGYGLPVRLSPLATIGKGGQNVHILMRRDHFDGLGEVHRGADGCMTGSLLATQPGTDSVLGAVARAAGLPMARMVAGMHATGQLGVMRRANLRLRAAVPDIDRLSDAQVVESFDRHQAQQLRHQVAAELGKPEYAGMATVLAEGAGE